MSRYSRSAEQVLEDELINEVIEEIRFEKTKYIIAHIKEHKDGI